MDMGSHANANSRSESTEESLWKAYSSDKTDCESRNKLAVLYHDRMVTIIKTYRKSHPNREIDDLYEIGAKTLLRAIKNFRPELKFKFATYLSACIKEEIKKARNPLSSALGQDGNFGGEDIADTDIRIDDVVEQTIEMDAMLFELTLQERKALELRYKDDKTISETAERMKISERRVHKLLETGEKKLRETKKDDR